MKSIALFGLLTLPLFLIGYAQSDIADEKQTTTMNINLEMATFAGGCFWCVEADLEKLSGVKEAISGYVGGHVNNPTYKQVSAGKTGHIEAVQVYYDPKVITYKKLLDAFWQQTNPTDNDGQFVDRGQQYRPAIFYHNEQQRAAAEKSRAELNSSGRFDKPVVTELYPITKFWVAEEYHQDYYKKNPIRYKFYRYNSGRDQFLDKTWGKDRHMKTSKTEDSDNSYSKPSEAELRNKLTSLQYRVTQQEDTEPPFNNAYWNEKREGIYVDIVSGEPLFSSKDKYDSGTGWPSFSRPLIAENIVERVDDKLFSRRIEVRSRIGGSHLGHLFDDGPQPTGQRYCINSASLRFIAKGQLKNEGYSEWAKLFSKLN